MSGLADFLLDERETSKHSYYLINWIPYNIQNAKPGDEDLLTEIQGIESLQKPLFDELVTSFLAYTVVHWLEVGSKFFLASQRN